MPLVAAWCLLASRLWMNRLELASNRPGLTYLRATAFVYISIGLRLLGLCKIRLRTLE